MSEVVVNTEPVTVVVNQQSVESVVVIAQGPQGPLAADLTALEARVAALEALNIMLLEG